MGVLSVDLRSDTVTRPCAGMRAAMAAAEVGDDVRMDDPTVRELETRVAAALGKEDGMFVPSGTMGNLLSIMSHCWERSQEVLLGDCSHIHIYEQGNVAQYAGVHPRTLTNLPDGTFDLAELESKIRPVDPQGHMTTTRLVCIENTHNVKGGKALPMEWLRAVSALCKSRGLLLHCDGARIFNAAAAAGVDVAEIVKGCDSVSPVLSKSLGAPVGGVVVGSQDFIKRAKHLRKGLGGSMRQSGILAAGGLYALDHNLDRLKDDHKIVRELAQAFVDGGDGLFVPDLSPAASNILIVHIANRDGAPDAGAVLARLETVTAEESSSLGGDSACCTVRGVAFGPSSLRLVPHLDTTAEMADRASDKIRLVAAEFAGKKYEY